MKKIEDDFGLSVISLLIIAFDLIFFFGLLIYGHFDLQILFPCLIAGILFLGRRFFISFPDFLKVVFLYGLCVFASIYNYNYIGELDEIIHFRRLDFFFAQFDMLVFKMPVAHFIEHIFPFNTSWGWFLNDFIMVGYIFYYFLGLFAIFSYFFSLRKKRKYRVGVCITSFLIFMGLNYLFYMLVPVSGPQHFQKELFTQDIPFSFIGNYFYQMVLNGQANLLDCFPSGHFGIALLATLWAYKTNRFQFYFMVLISFCMLLATLRLRYHYSLDLLFSPFLVILAYLLSVKLVVEKKHVDSGTDPY